VLLNASSSQHSPKHILQFDLHLAGRVVLSSGPALSEVVGCSAPQSVANGCKSFMVIQITHRNTCNSLGHRTSEPHVIHVPDVKSRLPDVGPILACVRGGRDRLVEFAKGGDMPSLESESE
jgi:hypothetical protein